MVNACGYFIIIIIEVLVHCTLIFIWMKILHFRMKQMNGNYVPLSSSWSPSKSISSRSNILLTHFKNGLSSWKRLKPTRKGGPKLQSLNPRDPVPTVAVMDHASLTSRKSVAIGHQKDTHMRMTGRFYMQPTTTVPPCLVQLSTPPLHNHGSYYGNVYQYPAPFLH